MTRAHRAQEQAHDTAPYAVTRSLTLLALATVTLWFVFQGSLIWREMRRERTCWGRMERIRTVLIEYQLRNDGRTPSDIQALIRWCRAKRAATTCETAPPGALLTYQVAVGTAGRAKPPGSDPDGIAVICSNHSSAAASVSQPVLAVGWDGRKLRIPGGAFAIRKLHQSGHSSHLLASYVVR